jgi:hypothetical protein
MHYSYFSPSDLASPEALSIARKKLLVEFHPDKHQDNKEFYENITQSINAEYDHALKLMQARINFNDPAIFSSMFDNFNKIMPEFKDIAQVFVHDGLLSWLDKPQTMRFWPKWMKETAKNIVKNEFNPDDFNKNLINFIKKLDNSIKKQ